MVLCELSRFEFNVFPADFVEKSCAISHLLIFQVNARHGDARTKPGGKIGILPEAKAGVKEICSSSLRKLRPPA